MKLYLKTIGILLGIAVLLGGVVVVSGIAPIKASDGHYPPTRWFLEFSKSRSVATHSMGIDVPDLSDEGLIAKGAGHYEIGCRQCHGRPGFPQARLAAAMTPTPPAMAPKVREREPEELFYVTKHGILFTGMPAWPDQKRDDEVWAVTAFLQKYPELSGADYDRLALGRQEPAEPDSEIKTAEEIPLLVREVCGNCHGLRGEGRGYGVFPVLAGQNKEYLLSTLKAYRTAERHSGTMQITAAMMDDELLEAVSEFYHQQPFSRKDRSGEKSSAATSEELELGEKIARDGLPDQNLPSCIDCHPLDAELRNPEYPILAGQYADYLELQLQLYKERRRGGGETVELMHPVVDNLKPDQMRAVSLFYESLR